jgi:hypothetical protein
MKLYELSRTLEDFFDNLEENGGEIDETLEQELDKVEMQYDEKVVAIAAIIKEYEADEDIIKAEEERLRARRKALENKGSWIRRYLAKNLVRNVKTPLFSVSKRVTKSVHIPEEFDLGSLVDTPLVREEIKLIPDKKAIKEFLESTGVPSSIVDEQNNVAITIVENTSVSIR